MRLPSPELTDGDLIKHTPGAGKRTAEELIEDETGCREPLVLQENNDVGPWSTARSSHPDSEEQSFSMEAFQSIFNKSAAAIGPPLKHACLKSCPPGQRSLQYGELTPKAVQYIVNVSDLTERGAFVDIGSGLGQIVLQIAYMVGCESYGVEIREDLYQMGVILKEKFSEIMDRERHKVSISDQPEPHGMQASKKRSIWRELKVDLFHKDLRDISFELPLERITCVFCNNRVFDPNLNLCLVRHLARLPPAAKVFVTQPFFGTRHTTNSRRIGDEENIFETEFAEMDLDPGCASWTAGVLEMFMYTRRGAPPSPRPLWPRILSIPAPPDRCSPCGSSKEGSPPPLVPSPATSIISMDGKDEKSPEMHEAELIIHSDPTPPPPPPPAPKPPVLISLIPSPEAILADFELKWNDAINHHFVSVDRVINKPCPRDDFSQQYGFLLPQGIQQMIEVASLNRRTRFLDIGAGLGNVAMQVGFMLDCTVYGIEIRSDLHKVSLALLERFESKMDHSLRAKLLKRDLRTLNDIQLLTKVDCVFVNNHFFNSELNFTLLSHLRKLPTGAKVIAVERFCGMRSTQSSRKLEEDIFEAEVLDIPLKRGSASWISGQLEVHLYVKK